MFGEGAVRYEAKTQVAHGSVKACRRHVARVLRGSETAGLCDPSNNRLKMPRQLPERAVEIQAEIDGANPASLVGDIIRFTELYGGCAEPDLFLRQAYRRIACDHAYEGWPGATTGVEPGGSVDQIEEDRLTEILLIGGLEPKPISQSTCASLRGGNGG